MSPNEQDRETTRVLISRTTVRLSETHDQILTELVNAEAYQNESEAIREAIEHLATKHDEIQPINADNQ
jgi:Arc/MetJ-type ribon-helix-helix transcriptional regulator